MQKKSFNPNSMITDFTNLNDTDILVIAQAVIALFSIFIACFFAKMCHTSRNKRQVHTPIVVSVPGSSPESDKTLLLTRVNIGCYNMLEKFSGVSSTNIPSDCQNPFVLEHDIMEKVRNVYTDAQRQEKIGNAPGNIKKCLMFLQQQIEEGHSLSTETEKNLYINLAIMSYILKTDPYFANDLKITNPYNSSAETAIWHNYIEQMATVISDYKSAAQKHETSQNLTKREKFLLTSGVKMTLLAFKNKFDDRYPKDKILTDIIATVVNGFTSLPEIQQENVILIMRRVFHDVFCQRSDRLYPSLPA